MRGMEFCELLGINEDFAAELVVDFVYGRYGKRLHRNSNLMDDNISLIMIDLYHI